MIQTDTFSYYRVEHPTAELQPERNCVDVAVLDMNHGWQNLGHDAVIHHIHGMAEPLAGPLGEAGLRVRVFSYDVRRSLVVPPPGRFRLLVGTGGPGHLDPRENDGESEGSQGIKENPSWEAPLYELFDSILEDDSAAFFAVCHTYGILCRWSGVANPVLRPDSKGGKSTGVVPNVLTDAAEGHPYFARLARQLPDHRNLKVTDNRLFDLVEDPASPRNGFTRLSYEKNGEGKPGDALTMVEFARDRDGVMPRFLGVNHHPEVLGRRRIRNVLRSKWERGEVTRDWYEERLHTLEKHMSGEYDEAIRTTSIFTFLAPVEFQLQRLIRERREELGFAPAVDENLVIANCDNAAAMTSLTE